MPELAEVEYFRKRWNPGLRQKIISVKLNEKKRIFRTVDTHLLKKNLTDAQLLESHAHGKQMLFRFSKECWLGVHLGMTGKLSVAGPNATLGKHDHLVLHQKKQSLVFSDPRLFGRILFHRGKTEPIWWTRLPPAILSARFNRDYVERFLSRHSRAPMKAVLLLQAGFPGIGNWMADEILWQTKIHPRCPAEKISSAKLKSLFEKTVSVSRQAIDIIGEDFSDPPKTWLFLYRWKKRGKCPRCQSTLEHATIGGRTTCWCPKCQKF